ncbi:MAG TPA: hemerythrin domain-containing protein [Mycobacteriales bacterium]|nr:hemerythrin domain-containing protein [Mycobacteriales bacterium]
MCEYCGCQQIPAIAALTAEHDELLAVVRDAAAAARSGDRVAAIEHAAQLLRLLRPHTQIEEQGLFPPMAREFAEHVASLQDDHRRIDRTLARVADPGYDAARWAEELAAALAELSTHIFREQDGLFPATIVTLGPADWEELDRVRVQVTGEEESPDHVTAIRYSHEA